jgi:hypothetical protein
MRVRPLSGKPLLRRLARRKQRGGQVVDAAFDPTTLFDSDTGYIFDLSDATTPFQEIDSTTTPSGNGDPIGTLLDLSGNDNHIAAPDDGAISGTDTRPDYVNDGSVGYADFLSHGPAFSAEYMTAAFTLDQPLTLIVAVQIYTIGSNRSFVDGGSASSVLLRQSVIGPQIQLVAGSFLGSGQTFSYDENIIVTAIANGATSKIAVNTNDYTEGDAGANDAGGVTFGALANGSANIPMRLYRAIGIGRVLTDDEITSARAWCAAPAGVSL